MYVLQTVGADSCWLSALDHATGVQHTKLLAVVSHFQWCYQAVTHVTSMLQLLCSASTGTTAIFFITAADHTPHPTSPC